VANSSKTLRINFCQNWSSIVEVMIKNFWCVFYASQCTSACKVKLHAIHLLCCCVYCSRYWMHRKHQFLVVWLLLMEQLRRSVEEPFDCIELVEIEEFYNVAGTDFCETKLTFIPNNNAVQCMGDIHHCGRSHVLKDGSITSPSPYFSTFSCLLPIPILSHPSSHPLWGPPYPLFSND